MMIERVSGIYRTNSLSPEPFKSFILHPLPPDPLFLTGIYETANQAIKTSRSILELFQKDQQRIETLGLSTGTTLQIFKLLQSMPLISIARAAQQTQISIPTVTAAFNRLQNLGIVREITSRRRDKLYSYEQCRSILNEGTEPITH